ncbi:uncharacterized protein LOC113366649 [Ctenocephalides felis]|uniref:uncharacterized protein LOC113366649 n=1 Tax=Ctenocephalides felis TaxID=7515 RepID=UPI000E6E2E38|nr:uncharacterized protein LOC113366649 [Ctenocephalides felis]
MSGVVLRASILILKFQTYIIAFVIKLTILAIISMTVLTRVVKFVLVLELTPASIVVHYCAIQARVHPAKLKFLETVPAEKLPVSFSASKQELSSVINFVRSY